MSFLSRGFSKGPIHFLVPSVSLFDLTARFFVPTHTCLLLARAGAVNGWPALGRATERLGLAG
jgi:hypothetical protein